MHAVDDDDSGNVEEATDNEEDMQAWCLLEESENEQWQEVISRRDRQQENSHIANPKKIIEGQMGESQSHHGLWSRGPCDA